MKNNTTVWRVITEDSECYTFDKRKADEWLADGDGTLDEMDIRTIIEDEREHLVYDRGESVIGKVELLELLAEIYGV